MFFFDPESSARCFMGCTFSPFVTPVGLTMCAQSRVAELEAKQRSADIGLQRSVAELETQHRAKLAALEADNRSLRAGQEALEVRLVSHANLVCCMYAASALASVHSALPQGRISETRLMIDH